MGLPSLPYCVIPPSWPVVSHDSGLFQGTAETGCPFESTFSALGVVAELEQPASSSAKGRKRRIERKRGRVMQLVKHFVADLNIAFYIRQNFSNGIVGIDLGHPDLA